MRGTYKSTVEKRKAKPTALELATEMMSRMKITAHKTRLKTDKTRNVTGWSLCLANRAISAILKTIEALAKATSMIAPILQPPSVTH